MRSLTTHETHRLWHCEFSFSNVFKKLEDGVPLKRVLPSREVVQGHPTENWFLITNKLPLRHSQTWTRRLSWSLRMSHGRWPPQAVERQGFPVRANNRNTSWFRWKMVWAQVRSDLSALRILENLTSGDCVVFREHIELFTDLPIKYRLISVRDHETAENRPRNLQSWVRLLDREGGFQVLCLYVQYLRSVVQSLSIATNNVKFT